LIKWLYIAIKEIINLILNTEKKNLKRHHQLKDEYYFVFQLSLFISLCLIVLLFHIIPKIETPMNNNYIAPKITIEVSDIPQTRQTISAKGQPVKPTIPITSDIKEALLTEDDFINYGDPDGLLEIPAPPPPPHQQGKTEYSPPKLIVSKFPEYPKELQKEGISGVIMLEVKVDLTGKVISHRVISNTTKNNILEKLAVETVYKCRYTPATENKKPIIAWTDHKFEFIDKTNH
jgi:TonB family protein